jgi:RNA polymerase sigma factor (sigma-70 family)
MIDGKVRSVLHQLRLKGDSRAVDYELSDRELLYRFVGKQDESAFERLLHRHGSMVLHVCQRLLRNRHDAEDAFQATFLVLARKANSATWHRSVGSWLYAVACRTSLEARRRSYRRRVQEAQATGKAPPDPLSEITGRELLDVLSTELNRLPEKYRAPMILCCLEGQCGDIAARQLGCSLSTLRRRLSDGRELLRRRLARRGVVLTATALSTAMLLESATPGAIPMRLATSTLKAATVASSGQHTTAAITASIRALSASATKVMSAARLKILAGAVLVAAALTASAVFFVIQGAATDEEIRPDENPGATVPIRAASRAEPGKDLLGDPLPPGALARLGTIRLRGNRCIFFPDSKRLLREKTGGDLQIFEVPTGKPLAVIHAKDVPGRREIVGYTAAFTRNGKLVAAVCWSGRCGIWETATGRLVRWLESGQFYSISQCVFSPDDKLVAVGAASPKQDGKNNSVGVYEVSTGRLLFSGSGTNCAFAPDGRTLVLWNGYGFHSTQTARRLSVPDGVEISSFTYEEGFPDGEPRSDGVWFFEVLSDRSVRVREVSTGEIKFTLEGPGENNQHVTYVRHAPGRNELLVVQTHPPSVACYSLSTGKVIWHVSLSAPTYSPPLSADGNTFVAGDRLGKVRVWDVQTGKERCSFQPGPYGSRKDIEVSPDGRTIATISGGIFTSAVSLWDAASGKLISDLPGHSSEITAAAFSPDGKTAFTIAKDQSLRTWDIDTGRERSRAAADAAEHLAVSPDGKILFTGRQNSGAIRVLNSLTGQLVREIQAFECSVISMGLTTDGKRLFVAGRDGPAGDKGVIRVRDAANGALLREFSQPESAIEQMALRPDGAALATSHVGNRVLLWTGSGKKVWEQVGQGKRTAAFAKGETPYRIGSLALSADGRWLAYSDQEKGIAIVDARTGRETGRATPNVFYQQNSARDEIRNVMAFSPDGKTVAWSGVESTSEIYLIEARTARVRRRLQGDSYSLKQIVFSPDGSRLLTSGPDGSALIWEIIRRPTEEPLAQPSSETSAGWWELLGEEDAANAYHAMQDMATYPAATVKLLQEKLKPVKEIEAAELNALVKRLDGASFNDREAAVNELVALSDAAVPYLGRVLKGSPPLEVKRRIEASLERIDAGRVRPERAVEVLEMIGNDAARALLRQWADGLADAGLTTDAARALNRMTNSTPRSGMK